MSAQRVTISINEEELRLISEEAGKSMSDKISRLAIAGVRYQRLTARIEKLAELSGLTSDEYMEALFSFTEKESLSFEKHVTYEKKG